jgi:phosphoribosylaminoimidazolecarboxamide formyltransferase/IMP cyclohydrolase
MSRRPIRRALVSVFDKTGLAELAKVLHGAGVEIVSTGSTAAAIEATGVAVTRVEQVTGFPECLDGRVKTLHPAVHAGLLADLRRPEHADQLRQHGLAPFDLLVSNLYPFTQTVAAGAGPAECIEQIDIGGPAMVRSAAKNHATVAVVTSPSAYPQVYAAVAGGGFTLAQRRALAARAFADIAEYDVAVAQWFAGTLGEPEPAGEQEPGERAPGERAPGERAPGERAPGEQEPGEQAPAGERGPAGEREPAPGVVQWPGFTALAGRRAAVLRYGENPHQPAALYADPAAAPGLAQAEQLHGKEMSYNNYVDTDAAWRAANDFSEPCVAIIKHANPCGIAIGPDVAEAHRRAHACDLVSAFGGVIAVNRPVTVALAEQVAGIFTEVVVAPDYADGAVAVLAGRKGLRVLRAPRWQPAGSEARQISGGLLVQRADRLDATGDDPAQWRLVAGEPAGPALMADLGFGWRAVRSVKSNAILLAADRATVGVGMGQVNRVDAARLAVARAGERARGAVAASDAFFPFPDGLQVLADAGVAAVVQPGGSVRDEEVIAAAAAVGLTLYLTGVRHFYH